MFILENVPLLSYSTMRLGGTAAFLTEINDRSEVPEAIAWAEARQLPVIMVGIGSNIVWRDEGFPGLVLVDKIMGVETISGVGDDRYVTVGSGVIWDEFVAQTVADGLSGIEFLSLVPGTVGATPVQNVGAYGQEVSQTIMTIQAYDKTEKTFVTLRSSDCDFGYRTSRFKTTDRGRFFIVAVTFYLTTTPPQPPYYNAVAEYFKEHGVTEITASAGRDAVIAIRSAKLPDPAVVANNGSFFANPIISNEKYLDIHSEFPEAVYWNTVDGKVKLSAAWLIENAGFKDFHDAETGMGTWPKQPLVLVNESATTTAQLLSFKQKIIDAVQTKFGVTLEQEPELLP